MEEQMREDLEVVRGEVASCTDQELLAMAKAFAEAMLICEGELAKRGSKPAPQTLGAVSVQSAEGFGQG